MSVSINIEAGPKFTRLRKKNGQIIENAPQMEDEQSKVFAGYIEDAIRDSVKSSFNRFSGDLENNVEANKTSSKEGSSYEVSANAYNNDGFNYAAWHEYADTGHKVALKEGNEPIMRWAKMKGLIGKTYLVTVTPTSFMEPGVKKGMKKLRREVRRGGEIGETLRDIYK